MSFRYSSRDASAPGHNDLVTAPIACPTCRSASITTTAKTPNADSYWRCESCGDVWNGARAPRARDGRFGR